MVDIQTVSIAIASAGALLAAIYYILQIRHQNRLRKTDLIIRLYSYVIGREFEEAYAKVMSMHFKDFEDFEKKYGPLDVDIPVPIDVDMVAGFFEEVGVLLHNKLIDIALVYELFSISRPWLKLKPIVEGVRRKANQPSLYEWFEYLYNELVKREQKLQPAA